MPAIGAGIRSWPDYRNTLNHTRTPAGKAPGDAMGEKAERREREGPMPSPYEVRLRNHCDLSIIPMPRAHIG